VLEGATPQTVLLLNSKTSPQVWRERLNFSGLVLTLPDLGERQAEAASTSASPPETAAPDEHRYIGAACTGAAARLVGVITRETLAQAVRQELGGHGERVLAQNLGVALKAYDLMAAQAGRVTEAQEPPAEHYHQPQWIELPAEAAEIAAPAIYVPATSEQVPTGLWRTVRPVIDYERCKRCAWICSTLCPDGVISVDGSGYPHIDYQHCKGCLICMAQCPSHAIRAVPEQEGGE
jgi:pyruvate ferredoxin oxidoreductase gamma subunit